MAVIDDNERILVPPWCGQSTKELMVDLEYFAARVDKIPEYTMCLDELENRPLQQAEVKVFRTIKDTANFPRIPWLGKSVAVMRAIKSETDGAVGEPVVRKAAQFG